MGDKFSLEKFKDVSKKLPVFGERVVYFLRLFFLMALKFAKKLTFKFNDISIELRKRIFTSLVFVFILTFSIFVGSVVYNLLITVVGISMAFELVKISKNIQEERKKILSRRIGLIYIAICCFSLMVSRSFNQGLKITIWIFFVVWSVDTFAYLFGKKFGKVKLAPEISPGKTYEGAFFGSVSGLLVAMVLYSSFYTGLESSFSGISFFIFSIIVVVLSQLGDLAESYVKRLCCVKDSGKFLPGHGGVCDRFDSLMFVAPFVFFIALINGGILF